MAETTMPIEVHPDVAKSFAKEYVEAVISDAMKILPSYQDRRDTLVVINPRRVAVILDKQARKGAVIPVELIEQIVEGQVKTKLQSWLTEPQSPFLRDAHRRKLVRRIVVRRSHGNRQAHPTFHLWLGQFHAAACSGRGCRRAEPRLQAADLRG